ncbi:MAG: single-stranded DNA-binding protein [bacterium]
MDLNKATIIGRLTRDPESRTTPTGQNVASYAVATNFQWTDKAGEKQSRVEYHNIVAWGKLADICSQYLRKGSQVYIEGRLQTRDWEGQDGVKRFRTEIVAQEMIMLGSKSDNASSGSFVREAKTESKPTEAAKPEAAKKPEANVAEANTEEEIDIEDIPF